MAFGYSTLYMSSEPLSTEKQKEKKEYFEDQGNYFIALLVRDNSYIETARNYYSSKRDISDFEYLEDVYGMQNPIDLGFTNIIKPRVDALIGLSILSEPEFTVAYNDKETIDAADSERMEAFLSEIDNHTKNYMSRVRKKQDAAPKEGSGGADGGEDPGVSLFMETLNEKYGETFESSYAAAAVNAMDTLVNDPEIDLAHLKTQVSKDYFITGQAYTREIYRGDVKKPTEERIPPEQLFTNRPKIDNDLKKTDAVVRMQMLRPHQILKMFGDKMTKEQAVKIFGKAYATTGSSMDLMHGPRDLDDDVEAGEQMDTMYMSTGYSNGGVTPEGAIYPVYHVEWLASTKIPDGRGGHVYREDRYEVYRVGMDVFLGGRRATEAPRRKDEPWKTSLSYKGIVNHPGNGHIVSTVLQMKELQDLYDIIMFFRNNTVATSGVNGSRVNIAAIPKALGKKFMDRLTKWITIRKQGLELVDPTEEGAELFQHYGEFKASIDGNAMQGITGVLESLTMQADIISGVPRQMLGIIEERDAVENVRAGMNQVSILSLEMFRDIDRLLASGLQGLLDMLKYAYRDAPLEGVRRIGAAFIPFTIDSDKFSVVDHEITVISAGVESAKLLKIIGMAKELMSGGAVDPDVVIQLLNVKSAKQAEYLLRRGVAKKKKENANLQEMQSQLEQAGNQIKKLEAEIERLNNNSDKLDQAKLDATVKRDQALADNESRRLDIEEDSVENTATYREQDLALKKSTVELEKEQILFGSGRSKEVNNIE